VESVQIPVQWETEALSPGLERLGREADHSPPSSAEVKNCGFILPLPHVSSWRGASLIKHRDNFTYYRFMNDGRAVP
jgi:hypothetical protein